MVRECMGTDCTTIPKSNLLEQYKMNILNRIFFNRLIWAFIVILSIFATIYISILLANRFNSSPLQTVIESTTHPVVNIVFPAVTICNYNRIDWAKIEEAKKKFIPNATKEVEDLFVKFVSKMEIFKFGNFDSFDELEDVNLHPLDFLNISQLNEFMSHSCEAMFVNGCWWRYRTFRCCDIFVRQKSEFGFCFAFNSVVNEVGLTKWEQNEPDWPVKTSTYGAWSGLRVNLVARASSRVPGSNYPIGMMVIIHHPFGWPNDGLFVPAGTSAAVALKPMLSYAMPSTRRYDPVSRDCIFVDEASDPKYLNLRGLQYMKTNCLSACRQNYMVDKCNCTVEPFFPIGSYKACTASDFHCLLRHNDLFNFMISGSESDNEEKNQSAMICSCMQECATLDYQTEILPMHLLKDNFTEEMIILDVHYQHGTLIKYRTDVVYGWLDLLVAFGGIAGLFMGASVLSGVELFYYFTIGFIVYMRDQFGKMKTSRKGKAAPVPRKILFVGPKEILAGKY
ncbi:pickpocket protein 19-like [Hermetia illucens]|uniref:pickpocket protein 19-like n=1 Tax=Hermetia illucens TaxID=343691 RepID=UPI0018CC74A0|nr:pickpocket protein 19-like [Hermetia illucens]